MSDSIGHVMMISTSTVFSNVLQLTLMKLITSKCLQVLVFTLQETGVCYSCNLLCAPNDKYISSTTP